MSRLVGVLIGRLLCLRVVNLIGIFVVVCVVTARAGAGEEWPGWRGPRGDGTSLDKATPVHWDAPANHGIRWKVAVPGEGHSSPIIWKQSIVLTTCDPESTERQLICLDRATGNLVWKTTVFAGQLESIHALNSRASGTPVTDGERIFTAFMRPTGETVIAPNVGSEREITAGEMLVAAFDFKGNKLWEVSPGPFISAHGFCSCPILHHDMVIVNGDHDGDSYIVALDKVTGKERWRRSRLHGTRSYVTPIIREVADRTQMVFSGSQHIISLDPADGSVHWKVEGPTEQMVASMVFDGKRFYMNCGYPDYFVLGLDPTGQGDVTETGVVWESRKARSYVPSPVVVDRYLIVADDRGTANCFDTETGKRHWQARMGDGFGASLIVSGGLVYLTAKNGETTVLRPGPSVEVLAKNPLGEDVSASAAIHSGELFLRGHDNLYCVAGDRR